jgi:hypothetical protein
MLPSHDACRDVMGVEGFTKLVPRHSIVHEVSGSVVGPPRTHISPQLLHDEEGLLVLYIVQEPKLGVNHLKPVIGLQRLSCLHKEW